MTHLSHIAVILWGQGTAADIRGRDPAAVRSCAPVLPAAALLLLRSGRKVGELDQRLENAK